MNTKALSTTIIVTIVLIIMVIATIGIWFLLPELGKRYGECSDVDYVVYDYLPLVKTWTDTDNPNRRITYWPSGPADDMPHFRWLYEESGYTSWYEPYHVQTLAVLTDRVTDDYKAGLITEGGYHWFICVAEAID